MIMYKISKENLCTLYQKKVYEQKLKDQAKIPAAIFSSVGFCVTILP